MNTATDTNDTLDRAARVQELRAGYLAAIPTEYHQRANAASGTLTNLRGGRPSDNLYDVVQELAANIDRGQADRPLWCEQVAADERQRDQDRRTQQITVLKVRLAHVEERLAELRVAWRSADLAGRAAIEQQAAAVKASLV